MTVERIVLVDDNEADNVYHEVVLRRAGFGGELQVFEMAEDALAYLAAMPDGPGTLVLLDINMPGMDGWAFAAAAAPLLAAKPALMLVMLTSSSAPEDQARAQSLPGLSGFVTKPLTVEAARGLLAKEFWR